MFSTARSADRVITVDAKKPTAVMSVIVMSSPSPGIARLSQPSIVLSVNQTM
ncbi:hypothetical protein D3C83_119110 [compost metagenome]